MTDDDQIKREVFAALMLAAMLVKGAGQWGAPTAKEAVVYADELLAELAKPRAPAPPSAGPPG